MPIQHPRNQYLIPGGRVYFDPYNASEQLTGEIPMGNCPSFALSISSEKKDHYSRETGKKVKDDSWVLGINISGKLTCDNFTPDNAAMWMAGTIEKKTQAATPVVGELCAVIPGCQYQLGATPANPVGVRNVTGITVKSEDDATTYVAGTDYNIDQETGRIQIIAGGSIVAGKVKFGYTPVAATYYVVKSGGKAELTGALRVVADNAVGDNRDWYLPKVTLAASGDLVLIAEGDDNVKMDFDLEVIRPANGESIYCAGRPVAIS